MKGVSELGLMRVCGFFVLEGKSIVDFGFFDENLLLLLCCIVGKLKYYMLVKCLKLIIVIGDNFGFFFIKISY